MPNETCGRARILAPLLVALTLPATAADDPLHRQVETELNEPSQMVELEVSEGGAVHLWLESTPGGATFEAEGLGVDGPTGASCVSNGTTPWAILDVEGCTAIRVELIRNVSTSVATQLHVVACPESEETLNLARKVASALAEIQAMGGRGELEGARERVQAYERELEACAGAPNSELICAARSELVKVAESLQMSGASVRLREHVYARCQRVLPPDHLDTLLNRQNLAVALRLERRLEEAHEHFRAIHELREATLPEGHPLLLGAKLNLAVTSKELGDAAAASTLEEYVHRVREETLPPDHEDLLTIKQNLAATCYGVRDFDRARQLMEHVVRTRAEAETPNPIALLNCRNNLAMILREQGEFGQALVMLEEVEAELRGLVPPDHPHLRFTRNNIASTRSALGDHSGAAEQFEIAREALLETVAPDHPDVLQLEMELATCRRLGGDLDAALVLDRGVVAAVTRSSPGDRNMQAIARSNLASTLREMGRFEEALALDEEVAGLLEGLLPPEHPDMLGLDNNRGVSLQGLGRLDEAVELAERVLEVRDRTLPPDHPELIGSRESLLLLRLRLDDDALSATELLALLDGQGAAITSMADRSPRIARESAQRELARLPVAFAAEERLGQEERSAALRSIWGVLEGLRATSTARAQVARMARGSSDLAAELEALRSCRGQLGAVSADPPGAGGDPADVETWRRELLRLAGEREELEQRIRRRLGDLGTRVGPPVAAEVAAALGPGDVLVSFLATRRIVRDGPSSDLAGEPAYIALVLDADGRVQRVDLGEAARIDDAAARWRAAIDEPLTGEGRGLDGGKAERTPKNGGARSAEEAAAGQELRAAALDPVLDLLETPRRLFVIADSALHLAPLDALPLGDGVVGDSIRITYLPHVLALSTSVDPGGPVDGASAVVVGGIEYGSPGEARTSAFRFLAGSQAEVAGIERTYREHFPAAPVLLRGADASKARLTEEVAGATYLHVATHGWFVPELEAASVLDMDSEQRVRVRKTMHGFLPEALCGIALAGANEGVDAAGARNGIMTAGELMSLDLTRCELAVLSACETNVGLSRAGQGIQSLQSALHAAGARVAITSLWRVPDGATAALFTAFYAKLWGEGMEPSEALWRAKLELRSKGHPTSDWAGWVLTGAGPRQGADGK